MELGKDVESTRLYESTRAELISLRQSSLELYNRALITLSSILLIASLSFITNTVPLENALYKIILHISWTFFSFTIVVIIVSFIHGQIAIKKLLIAAKNYYLLEDEESYQVSVKNEKLQLFFHSISGISFIIGLILLILFVIINTL